MAAVAVEVNFTGACQEAATALTFLARAVVGVGVLAALCGCRWAQARLVVARRARRLPRFIDDADDA